MSLNTKKMNVIDNDIKRSNTKCKRKKNLFKKCYELSVLCNLDINISVFDKERKQIEVCSSADYFTIDFIKKLLNSTKKTKVNDTKLKIKYISMDSLFK